MYGYIYKTTNLYNNKIYIGQHRSDKFDSSYYGSGIILCNIMNKYGTDNFRCELIEECNSEQELNEREIYWISYYNSTDYSIGYNLMLGGYKTRGAKHSEQTRRKISNIKKGCHPNRDYTKIDDVVRYKISNSLKEYYKTHSNPRYGAHLSEATKEKLRQANLGKKQSEETRAKRRGRIPWNKGIPMTEEGKQYLREVNLGKKHSEETKEKMQGRVPWNKGISVSAETKEKLRQINLGKKHSEETIAKLHGRRWLSNGEHTICVPKDKIDDFLSNGYHLGRDKFNPHV